MSEAVTVTVAMSMYSPSAFRSPLTVAEVSGGAVSSDGGATTVNSTLFSAETLPALSRARWRILWPPVRSTTTGAVYGCQAPVSPIAYSIRSTPLPPSSVAAIVTVAAPTYSPWAFCAPVTWADVWGGVVSEPPPSVTTSSPCICRVRGSCSGRSTGRG